MHEERIRSLGRLNEIRRRKDHSFPPKNRVESTGTLYRELIEGDPVVSAPTPLISRPRYLSVSGSWGFDFCPELVYPNRSHFDSAHLLKLKVPYQDLILLWGKQIVEVEVSQMNKNLVLHVGLVKKTLRMVHFSRIHRLTGCGGTSPRLVISPFGDSVVVSLQTLSHWYHWRCNLVSQFRSDRTDSHSWGSYIVPS